MGINDLELRLVQFLLQRLPLCLRLCQFLRELGQLGFQVFIYIHAFQFLLRHGLQQVSRPRCNGLLLFLYRLPGIGHAHAALEFRVVIIDHKSRLRPRLADDGHWLNRGEVPLGVAFRQRRDGVDNLPALTFVGA